jgi:hypothetical protein
MKTIFKTIALFFSCCLFIKLNAQTKPSLEFGILPSLFIYQGDLTPSKVGSYRTMKPGLVLFANLGIWERVSLRTNLAIGALKGDDAKYSSPDWRPERALLFTTPLVEISELAVVNILKNTRWRPYVFGGVGLSLLKITRDWSRFNSQYFSNDVKATAGLATDIQRSAPKRIIVLPAGIGAKYPLSEKISVVGETSYRVTFTDYLDGFSEVANPDKKDYYFTHSLGITYQFGGAVSGKSKLDCPKF